MALRRVAETGHSLHLCRSENFPPVRDGPLFVHFLSIAVPQTPMAPITDALIADLKDDVVEGPRSSKPGETVWWSPCTVWDSQVPLDRVSLERWLHLSWMFCARRNDEFDAVVNYVVPDSLITSLWIVTRCNFTQAYR